MRRFVLTLFTLCASLSVAFAQVPLTGAGKGAPGGGGGASPAVVGSSCHAKNSAGFVNPYTTPSISIGTASATRVVVVGVEADTSGGTASISSVVVGSTTLTHHITEFGAPNGVPTNIYYDTVGVGEGASATIAVSVASGTIGRINVGVVALDHVTLTPTTQSKGDFFSAGTQASPYPMNSGLTVPSTGFAVVFYWFYASSGLTAVNWTIASSASDSTTDWCGVGTVSATGAVTPSATGTSFITAAAIGATWGP